MRKKAQDRRLPFSRSLGMQFLARVMVIQGIFNNHQSQDVYAQSGKSRRTEEMGSVGRAASAAHLCCGSGIQPDGRATAMREVEISEDGTRYPVVDFHRLAQRYGVAHQGLES
jgi:hypothetical protein